MKTTGLAILEIVGSAATRKIWPYLVSIALMLVGLTLTAIASATDNNVVGMSALAVMLLAIISTILSLMAKKAVWQKAAVLCCLFLVIIAGGFTNGAIDNVVVARLVNTGELTIFAVLALAILLMKPTRVTNR